MKTKEKAATALPFKQNPPPANPAVGNTTLLALAPVHDQTMGDSLRLAVHRTKELIDQRAAEALMAFMEALANRD